MLGVCSLRNIPSQAKATERVLILEKRILLRAPETSERREGALPSLLKMPHALEAPGHGL